MKLEQCSSMFDKSQRRHEIIWLKNTALQLTHSLCIGDLVSLNIDAKYLKSTTPAKLSCKVIQPNMHELQCLHRILSGEYRTIDLERLPAAIDLQIGNNTTRIALTKAVALIHEANPTAVLCIPEIDNPQAF